ncbi:MAG TPA: Rv2578c family radical SAM protein [Pseudonocardiaceae bacterium]|jgi:DNA repair photolyase
MRWDNLRPSGGPDDPQLSGEPAQNALFGVGEVVTRTFDTPEFRGMTFYEVRARSILNKVPSGSRMPFSWTVNPYRGCSHACTYCFARNTHTYLDLDAGADFDSKIMVKVNAAERLRTELAHPRWERFHVAMGTNTDPYQRAEGRYRLMPGIIRELGRSGTPFSILTKGTLLGRDVAELAAAADDVEIGLGMSIAHLDLTVHRLIEPGTPSPRARLELVRRLRAAGLPCGVFVAPVLPWLTDSTEQLDRLLAQIAAAGATGATVLALHLRPGTKEWFLRQLGRHHPELVPRYQQLYARGSQAGGGYRQRLADRVAPLLRRHGLDRRTPERRSRRLAEGVRRWPSGMLPSSRALAAGDRGVPGEQLTLL